MEQLHIEAVAQQLLKPEVAGCAIEALQSSPGGRKIVREAIANITGTVQVQNAIYMNVAEAPARTALAQALQVPTDQLMKKLLELLEPGKETGHSVWEAIKTLPPDLQGDAQQIMYRVMFALGGD